MTYLLNDTHDPALRSWVVSANQPGTDFPIQNLPYGVFQRRGDSSPARLGVAIGSHILDLPGTADSGHLQGLSSPAIEACRTPSLNAFMALGPDAWSGLRQRLSTLLREASPRAKRPSDRLLVPMAEADMHLPATIGDYTDFYASIYHATNVGRMLRPDQPLMPNYKYVPVGYHGRASSIVASGTPVRRPSGQLKDDQLPAPTFGPSRFLDYELEIGALVGLENPLGTSVPIAEADDHLFGLVLLNDWSARDIQRWEYQPLGPFLAKSFATTISPWVVTMEALAPFRAPAALRPTDDPAPLPYLDAPVVRERGGVDITLEVVLSTTAMRAAGLPPALVSRGRFLNMYWTLGQLLAHHTSGGCNLRTGDLLGSGTVSGPERSERGCLLELTWRGSEPIELPTGETRRALEDGDEVTLRGGCEREGWMHIGFGPCRGAILPARSVL